MTSTCATNADPTTEEEAKHIQNAIKKVSKSSGVDASFILAIIMQESKGCVRVKTTANGVTNPGLMQSHNGEASCNKDGNPTNPCPQETIEKMISEGTEGPGGLKACMSQEGGSGAPSYYKAARCYNSGKVASSGNLGQGIATHCYVSDVANRLLGWNTGETKCSEGLIGTLTGGSPWTGGGGGGGGGSGGSSGGSSSEPAPSATSSAAPAPASSQPAPGPTSSAPTPAEPSVSLSAPSVPAQTAPAVPTQTADAAPTQSGVSTSTISVVRPSATSSAAASATPSGAPVYPHAVSSCQKYDTIEAGDFCIKVDKEYGISLSNLRSWNPGLDESCTNLWKGYQYCVKA